MSIDPFPDHGDAEAMSREKTVVVAMSGGVDSSVAAGLLKQDGYIAIGATLRFHPCDEETDVSWCCGRGAVEQARAVAGKLGIPHYSVDCADAFAARVLEPAWRAYDRGRTPSPCILCNRDIKFEMLLDLAHKLGANKVATGHYARLNRDPDTHDPMLLRGLDPSKDQSYFLFSLTRDHLEAAVFPLGAYRKQDVRRVAKSLGFSNADRPESQDACFFHREDGFAETLRRRFRAPARPGQVVDPSGRPLGTHEGIHRFTIGQRKGLGIALGNRAYVTNIDADRAEVTLSDSPEAIQSNRLVATDVTWTGDVTPALPVKCRAQIRYRHKATDATAALLEDGRLAVVFDTPQTAIAPGQAVVLYDGDQVLGGGWIDSRE
ncbi:MAG: tRNA 2-thiouridine(34) synthase MnmA [Myxococcota bacterium]|nr:tRNA 2-thiouridine(34) synthase MnmA [Myxococcota bacterium]